MIHNMNLSPDMLPELQPILETTRNATRKICAVASIPESSEDIIDNCAVPLFDAVATYDMPQCQDSDLTTILERHRELFRNTPGKTNVTKHFIPTMGSPVKIPPQKIPANYHAKVEHQITTGYY